MTGFNDEDDPFGWNPDFDLLGEDLELAGEEIADGDGPEDYDE